MYNIFISIFGVFLTAIEIEEEDIFKINNGKEFIIKEYSIDDPYFKQFRMNKPPVKNILKNRTLCLSSHKPHMINYQICPDCEAATTSTPSTYNYSKLFETLIDEPIPRLRVGIPGSKRKNREDCLKGDLKKVMDSEDIGLITGYIEDEKPNFYPIGVWDLEKLNLIGIKLWNILYSLEGGLGTFIWMEESYSKFYIPEELKNIFEYQLFIFTGHHVPSNKHILILSPQNQFQHPKIKNVTPISKKTIKISQYLNIDSILSKTDIIEKFMSADWYLLFQNNSDIFIIPQEKSVLDIRDIEDLERLLTIDDLSRTPQKSSFKEWDMDDA